MIHFKRAAAAAILAIWAATPVGAQSGWSNVGHGSLAGPTARATIPAHSDPAYRQLMLCVEGHAVRVVDVVVTYADNHSQTIHDGERFAPGECGRMFDLSTHRQAITSVDIVFDLPSLAGATVQVDLFAR